MGNLVTATSLLFAVAVSSAPDDVCIVNSDDSDWTQVEAGYAVCGLTSEKSVHCWTPPDWAEVEYALPSPVDRIYLGDDRLCPFSSDFGLGHCESIAEGRTEVFDLVKEPILDAAIGLACACQLSRSGNVACSSNCAIIPEIGQTISNKVFVLLDNHRDTYCGATEDGEVLCWGVSGVSSHRYNKDLGISDLAVASSAVAVVLTDGSVKVFNFKTERISDWKPDTEFKVVDAYTHLCGLTNDGDVICDDIAGEDMMQERRISGRSLVSVSSGMGVDCAVDGDGRIVCWGCRDRIQAFDLKVQKK